MRPRSEAPAPVEAPAGGWTPRLEPTSTVRALADAAVHAERPPQGAAELETPRARGHVRWAVAPRAAAAAALAVALLAGGVVLRASTAPRVDPVVVPRPAASAAAAVTGGPGGAASPTSPAAGEGDPSRTAPATAVLHVVGAVAAPGVVTLPADARVADAVTAAGGPTADADLSAVNLARVVLDGEQLHVPRVGEVAPPVASAAGPAPAGATGAAGDRLDLNTADAAALDALPGVGPVLAQRILERRATAPFTSVDELDEVSGIGPAVLDRLRPLVRV